MTHFIAIVLGLLVTYVFIKIVELVLRDLWIVVKEKYEWLATLYEENE
jgi:hypothetical protein